MSKKVRIFSLLIALVMLGGMIAACTPEATPTEVPTEAPTEAPTEEPIEEPTEVPTEAPTEEPIEEPTVYEPIPFGENLPTAPTIDTPLVVAYDAFSQKFSPYFGETAYDMDVAGFTQISLMMTDRQGAIIMNGIEGETLPYGGTDYFYKGTTNLSVEQVGDQTVYTAFIRPGMVFSDGEPVTADDVIFTYYTYLDPSYVGSTSLSSYDIVGLKDYQTQTTSEVFARYSEMVTALYEAGPDHEWSDADAWTQEQQDDFWARLEAEWTRDVQGIVDYVVANYTAGYADMIGKTPEEIQADPGLQVAFGMALWGFGELGEDGVFVSSPTGKTFDLVTEFPTVEDYYAETYAAYEGDPVSYASVESANGTDVLGNVNTAFIGYWGPMDEDMGGEGVPNIAGIKKIDDYTIEVTVNGFSAPAVYSILGTYITPLHYYGDRDLYDYENNMFGFEFGDLSKQQSLTATPLGAGPYKFVEYENKVVYFEANELYYRGSPKIREIQFRETVNAEVPSAVLSGVVDGGEMSGTRARFAEVASYNTNGETTGDVITTFMVDNLGYGYAGINADTVNVGGEPGSDASKNLRKAIATVLAVQRDVAVDSYYGEAAAVINYPISNTSWAAPQPTDEDYQLAFSVDVNGDPIYTAEMTTEEKYAASEQAALGFLEAAGFTVVDGQVTEAPEGAKLDYEVIVPAGGTGDHPAFNILTGAAASLANIGMTLNINDPSDTNVLWDSLDAGTQELWTAAWGSTIDPDMYQVYYSTNVVGEGGTDSNHYHIRDEALDTYIMDARLSEDQNYRKATYKQALDVIIDWAVEIPTYQRQNCTIFSTERVNIGTITPDITTFWGWMNDIELLEMN